MAVMSRFFVRPTKNAPPGSLTDPVAQVIGAAPVNPYIRQLWPARSRSRAWHGVALPELPEVVRHSHSSGSDEGGVKPGTGTGPEIAGRF